MGAAAVRVAQWRWDEKALKALKTVESVKNL